MPQAPRLCPAVPRELQRERAVGQPVGAEPAHDLAREQRADRRGRCCARARSTVDALAARERVAGQREHLAVERRGGLRRPARRRSALAAPSGPTARREQRARGRCRRRRRRPGAAGRCGRSSRRSARTPSEAMSSRTSSATNSRYCTTCSGVPAKRRRSSGSCVAMPDRAGVEVADAHHDAARRDQRGGREAELLGAEQRADDDVAAGAQAAVDLQPHAPAQVVADQHLLGLGEAELPGHARVPDRGRGGGARAAVHAGDHDVVGAGLGDAGRDRADARRARRA